MTDAASTEAPDPAILRAERRLRVLEELSEIGMKLARELAEPAESAAPDPRAPAASSDPTAAFARLSRAIRLTLALEARTDEALRALRAGVEAELETRRVEAGRRAAAEAEARRKAHGDKVERLVMEAAEREIEDGEALFGVFAALEERLEEDEAYQDFERLPLRETVERLCADLQLTPDWSRWEGEGWTPEPPFFRPPASVWRRPRRKPRWPLDAGAGAVQPDGPRAHCRE